MTNNNPYGSNSNPDVTGADSSRGPKKWVQDQGHYPTEPQNHPGNFGQPTPQGGYNQQSQPGEPNEPNRPGTTSRTGGGKGKAIGIIIALLVVIALAVGGFFLLQKDDEEASSKNTESSEVAGSGENDGENAGESFGENSAENSEDNSGQGPDESAEEQQTSEGSSDEEQAEDGDEEDRPETGPTEPYKSAMPAKLNELVRGCYDTTLMLRYDDRSRPEREMKAIRCRGIPGTVLNDAVVEFIEDEEYADMKVSSLSTRTAKVISGDPNNFAGYLDTVLSTNIFVINQERNIVMQTKIRTYGPEDIEETFREMGY